MKSLINMDQYMEPSIVKDIQKITICVNGNRIRANEGDTLASVLWANGWKKWHIAPDGNGQGVFCGVGHCFECLVTVNGEPNIRACQTYVEEGMEVVTDYSQEISK